MVNFWARKKGPACAGPAGLPLLGRLLGRDPRDVVKVERSVAAHALGVLETLNCTLLMGELEQDSGLLAGQNLGVAAAVGDGLSRDRLGRAVHERDDDLGHERSVAHGCLGRAAGTLGSLGGRLGALGDHVREDSAHIRAHLGRRHLAGLESLGGDGQGGGLSHSGHRAPLSGCGDWLFLSP